MRASSLHFAAPRVSAFGSTRFEVEVEVEVEAYAGLLRAQLRSDKHDMVISGSRSESEGVENVTVDSQKALFGRAAPTDVVCGCCWLGGPAYCNRRRTSLPRGFKLQVSGFKITAIVLSLFKSSSYASAVRELVPRFPGYHGRSSYSSPC